MQEYPHEFGLTQEEKSFLQHHGITSNLLFDASGMRKSTWEVEIRNEGKFIAINAAPCRALGHTIRTRAGHCIQCDPAKIIFAFRPHFSGLVYLATSAKLNLVKIGFAVDVQKRIADLSAKGYGGTNDWRLFYCFYSNAAGDAEQRAHKALREFGVSRELFSCSLLTAIEALIDAQKAATGALSKKR